MKKRDPDLEQFKSEMDGLSEKSELLGLFEEGYNAKQACDMLGISSRNYSRWFKSDLEFRLQIYSILIDQMERQR
jgi:hypothetical protein